MRTDILERKDEILKWIEENQTKSYIASQLQCKVDTLNSYLNKMGINYQGRQGWNLNTPSNYISAEEYAKKPGAKSHNLKLKLLKEGIKQHKCELCGNSEWLGQPIPLELHHKDNNHYNNQIDNLQILCPTCHALQDGNSGKNIGSYNKNKDTIICPICGEQEILTSSTMCVSCAHKKARVVENRPDREELKSLIRSLPFVQIGNKYGVSDNAIRKWCKSYNLPHKKTEINNYSDADWERI